MLEQYPISDILEWIDQKKLFLNPHFQRRPVWAPQAKAHFIDTILRDRPVPNIYIRAKVNLRTRRSVREVVDGQQRLRTIHEFANNKFALGTRAEEFRGLRYQDLDDEQQQAFLSYKIGTVQLFNADDDVVIDVFKRINSYGLTVNPQELRHAKYTGEFRWLVEATSKRWAILWDVYKVVGLRARVRMADDELMSQLYGIILDGVTDGGQPAIDKLYRKYDQVVPPDASSKIDEVLDYIISNLSEILETSLSRAAQFLMFFAAVAHARVGIPAGDMGGDMPHRDERALSDLNIAKSNLAILAEVLEADERDVHPRFAAFKMASAGTTQRIRSRGIRFPKLYEALMPEPI
jgi:hypothetical protein